MAIFNFLSSLLAGRYAGQADISDIHHTLTYVKLQRTLTRNRCSSKAMLLCAEKHQPVSGLADGGNRIRPFCQTNYERWLLFRNFQSQILQVSSMLFLFSSVSSFCCCALGSLTRYLQSNTTASCSSSLRSFSFLHLHLVLLHRLVVL